MTELNLARLTLFIPNRLIRGKLKHIRRNERANSSLNESAQIKPRDAEPGETISVLLDVKFDGAFNEAGFAAGSSDLKGTPVLPNDPTFLLK